ncbi:hypothetical protein CANARDRAFT_5546 [[Candida] arabinofermentans NRRL YB-2248]|uniref:Uncharacterized protein n=1 Tax=[Candida] arabinofermentans NRRL YB-2248 TaxID=983967 RepID=A0A1E4T929_9ASCO|nr:hypothetical protein CANARDRAFT_5546 [[Candida] arabinofermentans NRRL YB-2248]
MSGFQQAPQEAKSSITSNPFFSAAVNVGLFVAGVIFIQSPLMDMMVPQLQ